MEGASKAYGIYELFGIRRGLLLATAQRLTLDFENISASLVRQDRSTGTTFSSPCFLHAIRLCDPSDMSLHRLLFCPFLRVATTCFPHEDAACCHSDENSVISTSSSRRFNRIFKPLAVRNESVGVERHAFCILSADLNAKVKAELCVGLGPIAFMTVGLSPTTKLIVRPVCVRYQLAELGI